MSVKKIDELLSFSSVTVRVQWLAGVGPAGLRRAAGAAGLRALGGAARGGHDTAKAVTAAAPPRTAARAGKVRPGQAR